MTIGTPHAGRLTFVADGAEKIDAFRAGYRHTLSGSDRRLIVIVRIAAFFAVLTAVFIGGPIFRWLADRYDIELLSFGSLALIILIAVAFYVWTKNRYAFLDRRRRKRVGEYPVDVTFGDGVLELSSPGFELKVRYRAIDLVFETPKIFGFFVEDNIIFLPKAAIIKQSFPIDALISDVLETMEPNARKSSIAALKPRS
ncbi:MAG: hypothetical protein ACRED5_23295 [Propylenella sp.]